MSITIPIIAADGAQSTVTLPDPIVAGTGPTGTPQTLSVLATSDYNYPSGSAYQPPNSPWWALNNAWTGGSPGAFQIQYYPANFPNYTTISWNNPKFSYPELIIGGQGPNHNPNAGGPVWGPVGTKNGQSATVPSWAPSWVGKPLSALKSMVLSWDITYNTNNNDNFDLLTETFLGPAGGQSASQTGPNFETCFMLKDPGWWVGKTTHQATIGGISYLFVPGGEPTSPKSLTIIPASVYNNGKGSGTPWLSGAVDLWPILSYAASQGWTSMAYCLYGWEVGPEVGNNSGMTGSVTFNSLSFAVS